MSLQKAEAPRFWIVAGPNGSGKTTLYDRTDIEGFGRSVWSINPDLLSARLHEREGLALNAANAEALNRIWAWLEASIQAYQTVGVETVLSTDKYRRLVQAAKSRGFETRLLYVMLRTADQNVERVRIRVAKGATTLLRRRSANAAIDRFSSYPGFSSRPMLRSSTIIPAPTPRLSGGSRRA